MHAAERPTLAEIIEILADRLRRDLEPAREIVDRHATQRVREFHYFGLPQRECHLSEKYRHAAALETAKAGCSTADPKLAFECLDLTGKFGPESGYRPLAAALSGRLSPRCWRSVVPV